MRAANNADAVRLSLLGPSLEAARFERPEHHMLWLAALNDDIAAHQVNGRWHFRPRDVSAIARFETSEARERWRRMILAALTEAGVDVSALAEADRTRRAQMLGLLGSKRAGERDAAGLAAHRLIHQRSLAWYDVLTPTLPPPNHDSAADPPRGDWRATAVACAQFPYLLDNWEWQFLSGLKRFNGGDVW